MQLGMIGLGRMGSNMVRRLLARGLECVIYDVHAEAAAPLVKEGAVAATSIDEFLVKLTDGDAGHADSLADDCIAINAYTSITCIL